MPIRELFHVMHVVEDYDAAAARYSALIDQDAPPKHYSDFDKRWASLAPVGPDFVLEVMEPSRAPEDQGFPLPKFLSRFGQHLHSFAWFVDDEDFPPLVGRLRDHGVRVAGPRGLLPPEPEGGLPDTIFTHPRDTGGQLEFQNRASEAGRTLVARPDARPARYWSEEHPLGLLRSSHLTTAVSDLGRAKALYEGPLQGRLFHEEKSADRRSAFFLVGDETVVELAEPVGGEGLLAADLAAHGELPHAVTFQVADIDAARHHVAAAGVKLAGDDGQTITVDPADCFGAVVAFTVRRLPGDPRG